MITTLQWNNVAKNICDGIKRAKPESCTSAHPINVCLFALAELRSAFGCPQEYAMLAGKLKIDGSWGPAAVSALEMLQSLTEKARPESFETYLRIKVDGGWPSLAPSILLGIAYLDPRRPLPSLADLCMFALVRLGTLEDCPPAYTKQSQWIEYDDCWRFTATSLHLLGAGILKVQHEDSNVMKEVVTYYSNVK